LDEIQAHTVEHLHALALHWFTSFYSTEKKKKKTQTAKVAATSEEEEVVCLFMTWGSTLDLASK